MIIVVALIGVIINTTTVLMFMVRCERDLNVKGLGPEEGWRGAIPHCPFRMLAWPDLVTKANKPVIQQAAFARRW